MRMIFTLTTIFFFAVSFGQLTTKFEQSKGTQTPTYYEIIDWWKKLDQQSGKVKMLTMGMTDAGFPLHLVVVSQTGNCNFSNIHKNKQTVILINNGIHPGEPDGIDAAMLLARDIVSRKLILPDNIVLAIIPIYNIGGCLNRSANYRVDQNGPEEFGFRGNSQNLDLNRDFIKCDSKDARAFTEIFHLTEPDIFIDNHVSDGADYQHVMTLIASQHNKLGGPMGEFMNKTFEPGLYDLMKQKGEDLVPYVNAFGDTPENGWPEFWDSPRYSSGYGSVWHTFSFVPETHMLKPYPQRVMATYKLMQSFIEFANQHYIQIKKARQEQIDWAKNQTQFALSWQNDRTQYKEIIYKGYEAGHKASEVSGLPRLYYDRTKPFERKVKFYNVYIPVSFIQKPKAYIIPQGWWKVTDLLKLNRIEMRQLKKDTVIEVEVYHIDDYKTTPRQYEMHHPNSEVKLSRSTQQVKFRKGDWYIPTTQVADRFLIETLEPQAEDSYFSWNFFDAILGQKEGYSGYAFEDIAAEYLKSHPDLKTKLEEKRAGDSSFAKSAKAQLDFIYQNSPFFEPDYLRYPVYRVTN
ncbi:MAG: hypothetical protein C4308_04305 [Chitinophagaceae bacterium]